MLIIEIETGNDAFACNETAELARILRVAAGRIENGNMEFRLHDYNGNRVGYCEYDAEEEE